MGALFVFIACAGVAITMIALFGILLFRRWYLERRMRLRREKLGAITRSYMRRVAGHRDSDFSAAWSDNLKLAAVSHIHLLLRGGERARLMQMAELDGLLRATLRQSHSLRSARRIDAIRLLRQFGSEACIARLRELFTRDRNFTVRLEAAFALAAIHALPPPRETMRILGMFERKLNRLDQALFRASATHYPQQLALLLDDELEGEVRALIVDALGWSGDASVLPLLETASASDDAELRSAALRAAAQLGMPSVETWVMRCLVDPVAFVRVQAINCCATLGLQEAVPALHTLRRDDDLWVRLRAEQALDLFETQLPRREPQGLTA